MSFLATMEPQVFMYILSSITEGLTALGGNLNYFTGAFTQKLLSANAPIKEIQFSGRARHLIHLNNLLKLYIGTAVSIKTILELV